MSRTIKVKLTEEQISTIWEALGMLRVDWGQSKSETSREVLRDILSVEKALNQAEVEAGCLKPE